MGCKIIDFCLLQQHITSVGSHFLLFGKV